MPLESLQLQGIQVTGSAAAVLPESPAHSARSWCSWRVGLTDSWTSVMGYSYALSHYRIKHTTLLSNKDFTYSFNNTTPQIGMWMYTVEWILVRNPCLCTRLVDFTTVLFFRGVDQALLFSQSCSFRPDNGLNNFCCELTSTVQTLGALIIMESFDDDVYSIRARTQCVPLKLLVCTFFPFLSNSNTFM